MRFYLTDERLKIIARAIVLACPLLLMLGVAGNEIPASVVSILFLIHCCWKRDWAWTRILWVRLLLILWVYMVLRGALAEFWRPALELSLPWIRWPMFAVAIGYWLLPDRKSQRLLFSTLAASVLFLISDMLFQHLAQVDIFGNPPFYATGYTRLTGPLGKPRAGIIVAWMFIPVLALLSQTTASLRQKIAYSLVPLVGIPIIYLSGERMAFLLTMLGCVLLFLLVPRIRLAALAIAAVAAALIMQINAHNPEIHTRQTEASRKHIEGYTKSPYGQISMSALHMVEQHPVFGVGARNFRNLCPRAEYGPTEVDAVAIRCGNHTHNLYSEWLTEEGMVGLGLFLAVIICWARDCWRARRQMLADPLLAGVTIAVVLRLWPLVASASQYVSWSAMPFWLMVGLMTASLAAHAREARTP